MLRLGKMDCEGPEDFWQYYRNRTFGVVTKTEPTIFPATIYDRASGGNFILNLQTDRHGKVDAMSASFSDLRDSGKFGRPLLGNTVYGDTYRYMYDFARRESVKGINVGQMAYWEPDRYGLGATHNARFSKGTVKPQSNLNWFIYNPQFYTFAEAVEILESGKKIGLPLSHQYGLYLSMNNPYINLSYKHNTIGYLDKDVVYVHRDREPFVLTLKSLLPERAVVELFSNE